MNRKPLIIKKYGNRRLYDTTHSAYINLDEVAEMIQKGRDVQVVDAATGEDLTRLVLTQIVVQHAKDNDSAFPMDVLRQMVAACGKATEKTTVQYMKSVLDMYQNAFQAMATPPVNPFALGPTPFPGWPGAAVRATDATTEASMRGAHGKGSGEDEVDDLRRRVAELESLVSKRRTAKPKKGKTAARRKA
ncbi:MAG: polyhydroxyalkanoate synthesis regulator DNA-binding domain-containing protein [Terriglobales bacterium]